MAELLLFHHGHGLTEGVRQFAHTAREAGHTVHTPDLFEGRVFDDLSEGMAYVDAIEKGEPPADPTRIVHAYIASDNPPPFVAAPAAAPPAATLPTLPGTAAKAPAPARKAPARRR